ncbi:amidohydrolase family protein [Tundrisphaera sp. TA3]|uniref:amidohydrolase family protein n=1 Tax=Tundrisphaera sp. TA3 TaxID=3435775 RepID=UPI003EBE2F16
MAISRRDFLGGALAAAAAPACFPARRASGAVAPGGPYIDVHTHLNRTWNGAKPLTPDGLLAWMDEHNVERSVALPLVSPESSSYITLTETALAAAKQHPDRLIPFCCIDPRTSYRGGRAGLRAMLKEYVDQGAKGLGEHKAGLPIDEPRMMAIYEACDDLKLPVLFHMDDLRGTDVVGLPGLEKVLKRFPNVNFIGHGPGFWASISAEVPGGLGAYPKGPVVPGGALDRLFDACPNLWGDLSAGSGANALSRDYDFAKPFLIRRSERLLFGTDYLEPGQAVPQFDVLAKIELPPEVRTKIERGNAIRLLGLKETAKS